MYFQDLGRKITSKNLGVNHCHYLVALQKYHQKFGSFSTQRVALVSFSQDGQHLGESNIPSQASTEGMARPITNPLIPSEIKMCLLLFVGVASIWNIEVPVRKPYIMLGFTACDNPFLWRERFSFRKRIFFTPPSLPTRGCCSGAVTTWRGSQSGSFHSAVGRNCAVKPKCSKDLTLTVMQINGNKTKMLVWMALQGNHTTMHGGNEMVGGLKFLTPKSIIGRVKTTRSVVSE